jgi:hypothetical protein
MQALGLERAVLTVAVFGLVVAGVVVATEGSTFPGPRGAALVLAPAAAVSCTSAGPYRAPEQGSVGLPVGLPLCASGPLVVTTSGVVLDGWDVRGGIVVDAADVVVRRSRITGDGSSPYGIRTTERGSVRIEDTTVTGDFPEAGIGDDRWTAERVEISGVTHDGARLGSGTALRNSWLHDFQPAPGSEAYALTILAPDGDVLVEDNRIEMGAGPGHGSALLIAPGRTGDRMDDGPVLIRGNVLGGGEYTLRQAVGSSELTDVRITGNRFRRDAGVGPLRVPASAVLVDNTFVDGGLISTEG